jgi:putative restriction endonuclease
MHLALIEPASYLEFATPVPFQLGDGLAETGLLNELGRISGRAQAAVRSLSATDFRRIVSFGLQDTEVMPRIDEPRMAPMPGLDDQPQADFAFEVERDRVTGLTSRLLRDRVFRRVVLNAYGERCAVTGLKLINGGGRAEVEAAHIRPIEHNGPDIVNNGIALSGTVHWMFDRGLLGISDELEIQISRHVNDIEGIRALINPTGRLIGPREARDRPHPAFLVWHREHCFKH